jgi:hypothetical protein
LSAGDERLVLPVGACDGDNQDFEVGAPYIPGSLVVFLRGIPRERDDVLWGWTEADPELGLFWVNTAPRYGDRVVVRYVEA